MAIIVNFKVGETAATGSGLFQWDYGQVLEIHSPDIGSELMEVHFACANMAEAIVRPCSFSNGVGTVTIPDQCLEQASTVNAWLYQIEGTQGHTIKVMNLPITARTRPSIARDVPQEFVNRYTELITEINEAVNALEQGDVTASNAQSAVRASYAANAGNAESAAYATSAGLADRATNATNDKNGKDITETYLKRSYHNDIRYIRGSGSAGAFVGGLLSFKIESLDYGSGAVLKTLGVARVIVDVQCNCYSSVFGIPLVWKGTTKEQLCRLRFEHLSSDGGRYHVRLEVFDSAQGKFDDYDNYSDEYSGFRTLYYSYLSEPYPVG